MVHVSADLRFSLERDGATALAGRLSGTDDRLTLEVDDAGAFAGSDDAPAIRAVAEELARRGLTVRVTQGGRHLVTLGDVRAPWWQRRFTRTRHIRVAGLRGALTSARSRASSPEPVLPARELVPPATLWPLVPTMTRRTRTPGTTHDPAGGGAARLVVVKEYYLPGERQLVIWLHDGLVIGSGPDADVRLPGLADRHAVLHHDEQDEWVIEALAGPTRVHGAPVERQVLRTGAGVVLGEHDLTFYREEYADHGRPFGGRLGGEIGHQRPQPPRRASGSTG